MNMDTIVSTGVGLVFLALGIPLTFRPARVMAALAKANIFMHGRSGWFYDWFAKTPFGWLQRAVTRHDPATFNSRLAESPEEFPWVVSFARIVGVAALLGGVMAIGFAVTS